MSEHSNATIHNLGLTVLARLAASPAVRRVALAGGAVRDNLHGVPIKDLDFLIEFNYKEHESVEEHIDALAEALDVPYDEFATDDEAAYEGDLFTSFRLSGIKVEIIETPNIEKAVADYPDDISRVYRLPTTPDSSGLVLTQDYLDAVARKTITFEDKATAARVARLADKFPDFRIVQKQPMLGLGSDFSL